ncbi:daptide-type RiPP biosynthesis methyltransferase [Pseudofrankia inefficax]|uniref:Methyltransferase type 11 n=1 Tax=Pseudofrankia inefficax (strain DSM 45817 / CECT 9037 / DDB 130130 / EuI1c) TaxID=298654 RepID=E3JBU5_PSEI1|nr:daptide-type RiPP biosynthesis methyltransferase [Pseudofrankia inefficax]ADP82255.1 Methyltransferase type 11 [Pseudofrankia inefficax]
MSVSADEVMGSATQVASLFAANGVQSLYGPFAAKLYHMLTKHDTVAVDELKAAVAGRPGPALELGCGTGRLTFPLLEWGYATTALDLSPDMLKILQDRLAEPSAAELASRAETVVGDMTSFSLDRKFGIVVIGGSAIWSLDEEQRASAFARIKEHLTPDGRLYITVVNFPQSTEGEPFENIFVFTTEDDTSPLLCTVFNYVDPVESIRSVNILCQRVTNGIVTDTVFGSQLTHPVAPAVLEKEIERAGLTVVGRHTIDAEVSLPNAEASPLRAQLRPTLLEASL